jgi:amidase
VTGGQTWVGATARDMARAVRRGDTSAVQVVADHLTYIGAHDEVVNAFRVVRTASALAEAEAVDQQEELGALSLAGVPVAVKENTAIAGLPTWNGSEAARGKVAEQDDEIVRRLRGAGAVVVATSRMPELAVFGMTDDATAITRNPWRTDKSPGGSSGGAAAAVAAGLVPIAHGSDGMGSIRIPSACCGLVGIKPGRGVLPAPGDATGWLGLSEHGVLASTVADLVMGFAVMAGVAPLRLHEPKPLRIAVSTLSPLVGIKPDRPNKDAVARAAGMLRHIGHATVDHDPIYPTMLGLRGVATWAAAVNRSALHLGIRRGALQRRVRRHALAGAIAERLNLVRDADRALWRHLAVEFFDRVGVQALLLPALAGPPPNAIEWAKKSWLANVSMCAKFAPYAAPWNLAGLPAVVVPMGVRPDQLPVAVQLVGPPGSELTLLGLAGQLEQESPWLRHAPGWPRVTATAPVAA